MEEQGRVRIEFGDWLKTGVDVIDQQHKELIDRINKFFESLEGGDPKVEELLDFLIEYARFHFDNEENYILSNRCPLLEIQKLQHQNFIQEVSKLSDEFKKTELKMSYMIKFRKFLVDWLVKHISNVDKNSVPFHGKG